METVEIVGYTLCSYRKPSGTGTGLFFQGIIRPLRQKNKRFSLFYVPFLLVIKIITIIIKKHVIIIYFLSQLK